jgi:hypothetical protein
MLMQRLRFILRDGLTRPPRAGNGKLGGAMSLFRKVW